MIYDLLENLKQDFILHPMVNMCQIGDMIEYENKNVKYPFVNIDTLSSNITNDIKVYTIRIHVIDRQKNPLIAYNKSEKIIDDVVRNLTPKIKKYQVMQFTDNFNDVVAGCYIDLTFEVKMNGTCDYNQLIGNIVITELDEKFVVMEDGAFIAVEKDFLGQDLFYFGSDDSVISETIVKNLVGKSYALDFNLTNITGITKNILAIPSTYSIDSIEDENNLWTDITNEYILTLNLTIYNLNGVGIEYNVYIQEHNYDRAHNHNIKLTYNG